jgi:putative phosphoribosyl transferase
MHKAYFADRREAGLALAEALDAHSDTDDVVVLALPRGGVPVGYEVARHLNAPLDVIVVRKIGTPGHQELAMGAVASGGALFRNEQVISSTGINEGAFNQVADQKHREVRDREHLFRGDRDPLAVRGKVVIVIDDGIATGSTITAAIQALRQIEPARVIAAVPVAPPATVAVLSEIADDVVALKTPTPFMAVGHWYQDFPQVPDKKVIRLLKKAAEREAR